MPSNSPNNNPQHVAYGQSQPLINVFNPPVISTRNPGVNDFKNQQIGALWVNRLTNAAFILTSVSNAQANWVALVASGGSGSFASLTVTPGPISLTGTTTVVGTTSINASGSGVTTIGTGGTGAVNIGNATGNTAVTGTLTSSGAITATGSKVIAGTTLQANGDAAGTASTTSLSNVTATAAGAGTVTFAANAAGNIVQTGYIKMYVGATAVFVPYFATI